MMASHMASVTSRTVVLLPDTVTETMTLPVKTPNPELYQQKSSIITGQQLSLRCIHMLLLSPSDVSEGYVDYLPSLTCKLDIFMYRYLDWKWFITTAPNCVVPYVAKDRSNLTLIVLVVVTVTV